MTEWLRTLLAHDGYAAIFVVEYLNNMGIPLPGTTMILMAGYLSGTGILNFWGIVGTASAAVFLGATSGYGLGRWYGGALLEKIKWLKLTHHRLRHMEHFFKRYGAKGVFFAKFVSVLHPLIGLLSGIGKMPLRAFLFYNLIGSVAYVLLFTLVGKYLGQRWGFHHLWLFHVTLCGVVVMVIVLGLSFYWSHSIHTFFGHTIYRKKRGSYWG